MKELAIATTAVLAVASAVALSILPAPHPARAACERAGGRLLITSTDTTAVRCVVPGNRKD